MSELFAFFYRGRKEITDVGEHCTFSPACDIEKSRLKSIKADHGHLTLAGPARLTPVSVDVKGDMPPASKGTYFVNAAFGVQQERAGHPVKFRNIVCSGYINLTGASSVAAVICFASSAETVTFM